MKIKFIMLIVFLVFAPHNECCLFQCFTGIYHLLLQDDWLDPGGCWRDGWEENMSVL